MSLWIGLPWNEACQGRLSTVSLLQDVPEIGSPVLMSLHKHRKSTEHQFCEISYRFQYDKPLVNENCKEASKKERERKKAPVVGLALVHPESKFALVVAQVLDATNELEEVSEVHLERRMQALELTTPACQANKSLVCLNVVETLHEYMVWLRVCVDVLVLI